MRAVLLRLLWPLPALWNEGLSMLRWAREDDRFAWEDDADTD